MSPRLCLAGAFALAAVAGPAALADGQGRGEWFRGLKQPGTDNYCCDIADCRRTEADWRDGQWWAVVQGAWVPIPRNKELSERSIDGEAYVCSGWARRIFCFIKPNMPM